MNLSVKNDLEQQVAELALEPIHVALGDGFGHFVSFFDGVRGDGLEGLHFVPWATGFRIPQLGHDFQQTVDFRIGGGVGRSGHNISFREQSFIQHLEKNEKNKRKIA